MENTEKQTIKQEILDKLISGSSDDLFTTAKNEGISELEFDTILDEAFKHLMKERNTRRVVEMFSKYSMQPDKYSHEAIDKFNVLFEDKEYLDAFYLGTVFSVSRKRSLAAGLLGMQQLMSENMGEAMNIENKYNILHDMDLVDVDESIRTEFVQSFERLVVRPYVNQNQPKALYNIIESLGIYREYENNPLLIEMFTSLTNEMVDLHNRLLESGRAGEACAVMEDFRLLNEDVPLDVRSKVLDAAEAAHHKKLQEYELKEALFLKQKYSLFLKSVEQKMDEDLSAALQEYIVEAVVKEELDNVSTVIEEYSLPKDNIVEAAGISVYNMLQTEKYAAIINTIRVMKVSITDPKVINEVTLRFHQVYEQGNMEIASHLAFYFKLNEPRGKKASIAYWKTLLENDKFGEARKLKKERRLPNSACQPLVIENYKRLVGESRKEEAAALLKDYNVNLSFGDWIIQKIKMLFGGN